MNAEGLAWFILGEGTIGLGITKNNGRFNGYITNPYLIISNTELELIEETLNFLRHNDIGCKSHTVRNDLKHQNWKPQHRVLIVGFKSCGKLLDLILPYLIGKKQRQAYLLLSYIKRFKRGGSGYTYKTYKHWENEWSRLLTAAKYHDAIQQLASQVRPGFCKWNFKILNDEYLTKQNIQKENEDSLVKGTKGFLWKEDEIKYLKTNWQKKTDIEIAKQLNLINNSNRTSSSIIHQRINLKLLRERKYPHKLLLEGVSGGT